MEKTVVITGATSGFGAACARAFANLGCRLVLTGRRSELLEQAKKELSALCPVHTITLDVRDRQAVEAAFAALPPEFAEVDLLVNNAGLALGLEPAQRASLDDWDTMVDTNVKGVMYCTRALLPGMVTRNRGQVVNIGSVAGSWPYPGGNVYGATKAFVEQFSRNLRADLLGTAVRVTNIAPGMAETEFSKVRFKGDEERAHQVYLGTEALLPEDIAEIVVWVSTLPTRVNINTLEVMSVNQSWGPFAVHRIQS
ncbi:NAD(P)-dependent oxidoreductase [Geomonas silvestris]|uniref:NAD(P)-dependent oxidoreductase n=1 Tax=Geomonas silvestris TaxID=2740184 RepID=A0A6V8MNA5_9BACT|nr:SDR family oxidoreductase [Geomonas silvestris]GFO61451.1 NAD(P)-dependent oxidoreductase [Geomonas silvestris]